MTSAPYAVGAVTYSPAASSKLQLAGMGRRADSGARMCVAYAPWVAPKTRSPGLNLGREEVVGAEMTVPANSEPEIQGRGGWFWYLPRICRRSKKLMPQARMRIRYLSELGWGVGRVETVKEVGEET